jgi:Berberine and berberine like
VRHPAARPSTRLLRRQAGSADPLTAKCHTWIAEFGEALEPYVDGAYINVPNAGMSGWEVAYWGPNVDRLRAVKAKYDTENVFDYEQSVPLVTG